MFRCFIGGLLLLASVPAIAADPVAYPTNPEMTAIFQADQAARSGSGTIDWAVVSAQDAERRRRTQALLDAGALQSGDDYFHAAFVFQHGGEPANYLKAHALAVIAIDRGKREATWIAAATLDRYLQSIDQPQIYGTQFSDRQGEMSQEPYSRGLLSDAIRDATGVPTLKEQEERRLDLQRRIIGTANQRPPSPPSSPPLITADDPGM